MGEAAAGSVAPTEPGEEDGVLGGKDCGPFSLPLGQPCQGSQHRAIPELTIWIVLDAWGEESPPLLPSSPYLGTQRPLVS